MDDSLDARLEALNASLNIIIERQGILTAMLLTIGKSCGEPTASVCAQLTDEMIKTLEKWTEKLKEIVEVYENGN